MRHSLLSAVVVPLAMLALAGPAAASPEAKACSAEADAKGLHGAEREAYRSQCLKTAAPAAAAPAAKASAPVTASKPASGGSAASKVCSDQATAQGLHGAEREAFRTACLKSAPAPATAAPVAKPAASKTAAAPVSKPAASKTAASTPATPKSAESQACSAAADAKGLHGADREAFRNQCLKGAAPVAPAKPAPAAKPAAAAKPVATREATPPEPGKAKAPAPAKTPGTRTPAQLASDQRIHDCGQQWQAAKAAGRLPSGQTWPQYWSACSARMKAAGK